MSYPCIPTWNKERPKDEFDYPLRSKNEILFENEISPPKLQMHVIKTEYTSKHKNASEAINKSDMRDMSIKLNVLLESFRLTPLQKKRLIYLLGNRYKGGSTFKICVRQYDNPEHNMLKALDILKQLYYETKRAPAFIWERMTNKQRRSAKRKYLGKTKEEQDKKVAEIEVKLAEDKNRFDELMKDPTNFSPEKISQRWNKVINANTKTAEEVENEEKARRTSIEGLINKEQHYKNLVSQRVLSEKAYKTFFENKLNKN
jgi:hypothetical protein